jgi:hypothetical protein
MDEWLQVNFPEQRDVLVDGTICGTTNKAMLVQRGTHIVTLGGTQNYVSPPMPVQIFNTTKQAPMILVFTPQ